MRPTLVAPGLGNPWFLTLKAALATLLALLLDALTGNPDSVSSTFIAVLCVSPTVLMGLRRALTQMAGSVVGGVWGAGLAALGAPLLTGVPVAVGGALLTTFALRLGTAYPVAAFSALFLQAVPRGGPVETLEVRVLAVATAAVSGFLVNVLVSGGAYRGIFGRRLVKASGLVRGALPVAARGGPDAVAPVWATLATLEGELDLAVEELRWRRREALRLRLEGHRRAAAGLREALHLACELHYLAREDRATAQGVAHLAAWLEAPVDAPPAVPESIAGPADRLVEALWRLPS